MPRRILVTRPKAQNKSLVDAINATGDLALELPLLEIVPISSEDRRAQLIKNQVLRLAEFEHVIFISTNAAELACEWIDQYWADLPVGQKWYGIGSATTEKLKSFNSRVIANAVAMNSEALLGLPGLQSLSGQRVLICRGVGGRGFLRQQLEQNGAEVSYCELYERRAVEVDPEVFLHCYQQGIDFLTVTSGETIQKLLDQAIISNIENQVRKIPIIVPSNRLVNLVKQLGFEQVLQAENASVAAMLKAIK